MDRQAHHLANALVGNVPDAAALEATLLGPELRFDQPAAIAVSGADLEAVIDDKPIAVDTPHRVESGGILRFGARRSGTRAYIAIEGGIDVLPVLGSRSTHVISGLGGIDGRALRAGDRLALGSSDSQGSESNHPWRKPSRFALHVIDDQVAGTRAVHGARLRAMRGPQDYYFQEPAFDWLARTRFTISPQSDRMGYRLVPGASRIPNPESRMPAGSMISDAAFTGGIQIPPSGEPILLMADRQTTGGYPQIATVITADLPLAGQLAPGDWIEFQECTRDRAVEALRARSAQLSGSRQ